MSATRSNEVPRPYLNVEVPAPRRFWVGKAWTAVLNRLRIYLEEDQKDWRAPMAVYSFAEPGGSKDNARTCDGQRFVWRITVRLKPEPAHPRSWDADPSLYLPGYLPGEPLSSISLVKNDQWLIGRVAFDYDSPGRTRVAIEHTTAVALPEVRALFDGAAKELQELGGVQPSPAIAGTALTGYLEPELEEALRAILDDSTVTGIADITVKRLAKEMGLTANRISHKYPGELVERLRRKAREIRPQLVE